MLGVSEGIMKFEKAFQRIFKLNLRDYQDSLAQLGFFSFDVVKFDDWAHTQGYSEKADGSLYDWLRAHYGEKAVLLMRAMLGG